jgi:hypothetical protein
VTLLLRSGREIGAITDEESGFGAAIVHFLNDLFTSPA